MIIVVLGVAAWGGLAVLLAIAVGRTIAEADRRDSLCCPHPESEAPETIRGEFRALIVR